MKKFIIFIVLITSVILFAGCKSGSVAPVSEQVTSSRAESSSEESLNETSSAAPSSAISEKDKEQLKNISVTYTADDLYDDAGKQRMLVVVENKGDKTFSGNVMVTFWGDGQSLGSDLFPVKELKPGSKGQGEIYIIPSSKFQFIYDISGYSFVENTINSDGKEDENKSKILTQNMYEGFGGSGNKEFATSWYPYIKKLAVYENNDNYYVVVTVSSSEKEITDKIGNAVFGNTAFGDGVDGTKMNEVIVKDQTGKTLFQRSE